MVSFSTRIKRELAKRQECARHCLIAELAAIVLLLRKEEGAVFLYSENRSILRHCLDLTGRIFGGRLQIAPSHAGNALTAGSIQEKERLFETLKIKEALDPIVIQHTCCKRSFIRGAFLAAGSVSDPQKGYHFEIVCPDREAAHSLQEAMSGFRVEAKIVERGKYVVLYLKEGSQIVDILNVMGAHVALMELENVRIVKEMRNAVNRQVNCETANLNKTVIASSKQIEDILFIDEQLGLSSLPEALEETARIRLKYPELPFKELGSMLSSTVGKSGINHRLKKISGIADAVRTQMQSGQTLN